MSNKKKSNKKMLTHIKMLNYHSKSNKETKSVVITESEDGKIYVCGNKNIIDKISDTPELNKIVDIVRQEQHQAESEVRIPIYFSPLPCPFMSKEWKVQKGNIY